MKQEDKQFLAELAKELNTQDNAATINVYEDFTGGEGFYKLQLDYLNKKQVEEIEATVRAWNKEIKPTHDNIKACIGMCLTDASEQRFKDYNTNLKDCLVWLEKQGEKNTADVTPKFKVGDKVVLKHDKSCVGVITHINFWNIQLEFEDSNNCWNSNTCWFSEEGLEPYEMAEDEKKIEKKTRRMTNQELADWLRKCPEEFREFTFNDGTGWVYSYLDYLDSEADEPVNKNKLIRRNHGEWQEPLVEI